MQTGFTPDLVVSPWKGGRRNRRQVTPRARALTGTHPHPHASVCSRASGRTWAAVVSCPTPTARSSCFWTRLAYPRRWEANDAELIAPGAETAQTFRTQTLAGAR